MDVRLVKAPRSSLLQWGPLLMTAIWAGLVVYTVWIARTGGRAVPLCTFKRITGTPCPTCGGTRAALSIADGDVVGAWLFNPFLFLLLLFLTVVVAIRVVAGRRIEWNFSRSERRVVWIALVVVFVANWAYVIAFIG